MRVHEFIPALHKSAFASQGLMLRIESWINREDGKWITGITGIAGENQTNIKHYIYKQEINI